MIAPLHTADRNAITDVRAGFSLLELVVVISLLAIITASVLPLFSGSMGAMLKRNLKHDLVAVIGAVQQQAITESTEFRIFFFADKNEGAWWVEKFGINDLNEEDFIPVREDYGQPQYFPPSLTLRPPRGLPKDGPRNAHFIACYPNGASDRVKLEFTENLYGKGGFIIDVQGVAGKIVLEEQR